MNDPDLTPAARRRMIEAEMLRFSREARRERWAMIAKLLVALIGLAVAGWMLLAPVSVSAGSDSDQLKCHALLSLTDDDQGDYGPTVACIDARQGRLVWVGLLGAAALSAWVFYRRPPTQSLAD